MTQKDMLDILVEEYRELGRLRGLVSREKSLDERQVRDLEAHIRAAQEHLVDNISRVQRKDTER